MLLPEYLDRFCQRVVQDALAEASSSYWLERAAAFETALSRPEDFPGEATEEEIAKRDAELHLLIAECRKRAATRENWLTDLKEQLRG